MTILETEIGIPILDGYVMDTRIGCHPSQFISLSFHALSPDSSSLIILEVLLIQGYMRHADIELTPFLPPTKAYSLREESIQNRKMTVLEISFLKGSISFVFQSAFYVKMSRTISNQIKSKT